MQDQAENPSHDPVPSGAEEVVEECPISDGSRWLAAASYLFVSCLFVLYEVKQHRRDDFVRFHARQGFALCFVEVVLIVVSMILGHTLGSIPVLGAIIMIAFKLAAGLLAVGLSAWGFVEALGGQKWQLPILGEYAKRVPVS
ncbi:MAG: DUF4870 domain-containing protein [Candidatus Krumholzibacteriia bacterium]